ncbi:hypothetical protein ZWY2020_018650 [Hordeum vulgare]|nr:hypothetical protein ZWY2020_018650 [Hordeum vulgare]
MSSGRWVYDEEAYPLYKESACRFMSENLACGKYGRTDLRYQHWRWQPHGCDLPRFDAARLLEKLRRKRLACVGGCVQVGSFETPAAKEDEHYGVTKAVDGVRAFELALTTWADWLEFHVDRARTRLFFVTMSPTHLPSDELGDDAGSSASHRCYNETEPIAAAEEGPLPAWRHGPTFARAVEEQARRLGARGVAVRLVKVTGMSERRKDAHPSVHRRQWDPITDAQARDPSSYADCIHWCLPGVPDVWNHLLYAHIVS